jgi:hypothetical protein
MNDKSILGTIIVIFVEKKRSIEVFDGLFSIGYTDELDDILKEIDDLKKVVDKEVERYVISKTYIRSIKLIEELDGAKNIKFYFLDDGNFTLYKIIYDGKENIFNENENNDQIIELELKRFS